MPSKSNLPFILAILLNFNLEYGNQEILSEMTDMVKNQIFSKTTSYRYRFQYDRHTQVQFSDEHASSFKAYFLMRFIKNSR